MYVVFKELNKRKTELRRSLQSKIREMQSGFLANTDREYFRSCDATKLLNSKKKWVF